MANGGGPHKDKNRKKSFGGKTQGKTTKAKTAAELARETASGKGKAPPPSEA